MCFFFPRKSKLPSSCNCSHFGWATTGLNCVAVVPPELVREHLSTARIIARRQTWHLAALHKYRVRVPPRSQLLSALTTMAEQSCLRSWRVKLFFLFPAIIVFLRSR